MKDTTEKLLLRQDSEGICKLTLNRPHKLNALSQDLTKEIFDNLQEIATDKSIKVVILAANGRAFCTGHDLEEIQSLPNKGQLQTLVESCAQMMMAIIQLPQPVIAQVQGITTAAGCQLVAQADLAVAASEAKFATSGINLGIFCYTPAVPLARNVARKQTMEMLLTGDFIEAATAVEYGLVNRAVPIEDLEQSTWELAQKIAAKNTDAIALGKKFFYGQMEQTMEQAYKVAINLIVENILSEDTQADIKAFLG